MARDPNNLSFLDATRTGSEESILKEGPKVQANDVQVGAGGRSISLGTKGIMREDVVTVSYGEGDKGAQSGSGPDRRLS